MNEFMKFDYWEFWDDEAQIVGECAGLAEVSTDQREEIARLVKRLVPEPLRTLSVTNLTTHQINVEDRQSAKILDDIRQKSSNLPRSV